VARGAPRSTGLPVDDRRAASAQRARSEDAGVDAWRAHVAVIRDLLRALETLPARPAHGAKLASTSRVPVLRRTDLVCL